jgi:hypothetical protein
MIEKRKKGGLNSSPVFSLHSPVLPWHSIKRKVLLHLLNNEKHAQGIGLQFKTGAKGSKRPVLQFQAEDGTVVITPDLFQLLLFKRPKKVTRYPYYMILEIPEFQQ